ncbi:MAG: Nif3-like dinuclear metal center hexameric protein [Ruminiclostridium sp.]|nr:Nif3-like dinuclear metal center hexameric protein [Ruminiclostridium sp.]
MTVGEVYDYLNTYAPFRLQDGFDNSGLLVGSRDKDVYRIAVCLDITNEVVEECEHVGAQLIVSHHPVIFHGLKRLDENNPVYKLIRADIAAICAHTNVDMVRGGISDIMYDLMGFGDPKNAPVLDIIHPDKNIGYGRIAYLDFEISAEGLAEKAKNVFSSQGVKYCDGGKSIKSVAVCSGAGNDEVYNCIKMGIDAIITGDVKHHGFVDAKNAGVTVIDAGHYATENIIVGVLKQKLAAHFPEADIFEPEANAEVCRYI